MNIYLAPGVWAIVALANLMAALLFFAITITYSIQGKSVVHQISLGLLVWVGIVIAIFAIKVMVELVSRMSIAFTGG